MSIQKDKKVRMQEKIFTVSCLGGEEQNEEMNRFLRANKVVCIEKQFCTINGNAYWSFCIEFLNTPQVPCQGERREKIDYKNVLDEATFLVFSRLRAIRKAIADEEAIPAFSVFTDAELAEISKLKEITEGSVRSIQGIGEKRVEKYAKRMIEQFKDVKAQEQ